MPTLVTIRDLFLIISAVAVPIVIALSAARVQKSIAQAALQKDYVQIALGILREPNVAGTSQPLRVWAADVLEKNAPVPLSPELKSMLVRGTASLPRPNPPTGLSVS